MPLLVPSLSPVLPPIGPHIAEFRGFAVQELHPRQSRRVFGSGRLPHFERQRHTSPSTRSFTCCQLLGGMTPGATPLGPIDAQTPALGMLGPLGSSEPAGSMTPEQIQQNRWQAEIDDRRVGVVRGCGGWWMGWWVWVVWWGWVGG